VLRIKKFDSLAETLGIEGDRYPLSVCKVLGDFYLAVKHCVVICAGNLK
jgi:hypothetical protein